MYGFDPSFFYKRFDSSFFHQLGEMLRKDDARSRILIYGKEDGASAQLLKGYTQLAQEVVENKEVEEGEVVGIPPNEKNFLSNNKPVLSIHGYNDPFLFYFLYDWSICLPSGPDLERSSGIFFDCLTNHSLRGVIVLVPKDPDVIQTEFSKRGFKINHRLQETLRNYATDSLYRNLLVFCNDNEKAFYYSHPKSGNNWLQYCLLHLATDRSFVAGGPKYRFVGKRRNISKLIIHTHGPDYIPSKKPHPDKDILMVIVRNYFETMISCFGSFEKAFSTLQGREPYAYFKGLSLYDQWNPDKRLLIYYEDLVENFESEMARVLAFFDEDEANLDEFMLHYEDHKASMLKRYDSSHGVKSKNQDLLWHSRDVPIEKLQEMENYIRHTYPDLWDKYLTRYSLENRD